MRINHLIEELIIRGLWFIWLILCLIASIFIYLGLILELIIDTITFGRYLERGTPNKAPRCVYLLKEISESITRNI